MSFDLKLQKKRYAHMRINNAIQWKKYDYKKHWNYGHALEIET